MKQNRGCRPGHSLGLSRGRVQPSEFDEKYEKQCSPLDSAWPGVAATHWQNQYSLEAEALLVHHRESDEKKTKDKIPRECCCVCS